MYSGENFRFRFNPFRDFVYSTQFLQAEAMKYAYNHWRRAFRGPQREYCSGILVWQLNDIWPATSWALVDVDWNRKASFYITKRALAKVVVGMERIVTGKVGYMVTSYPEERKKVEIWGVNGHLERITSTLKLVAFDIESGKPVELPEAVREMTVELLPNQTTELTAIEIPQANTTALAAYLFDPTTNDQLARWISWPEPMKFVHFSKSPDVKVELDQGEDEITLSTSAPVKGVIVGVPVSEGGNDATFDDNFVDLVPGESVKIMVSGIDGRKLEARWLCDWENEADFEL
jgi:beta-mannosidase